MGARANLVVLRDREWKLYYDHWCAERLDDELFWGPDLATAFVESREPMPNRNEWLDDVWCEGAAIIDHDAHVLLWFGGSEIQWDLTVRRAFLALMREVWTGWDVRWAQGDLVEVGGYLGLPAQMFLTGEFDDELDFEQRPEGTRGNKLLITIQAGDSLRFTRCDGDLGHLFCGQRMVDQLLNLRDIPTDPWEGDFPTGGIHLDTGRSRIVCWEAWSGCEMGLQIAAALPEWDVEYLGDRVEGHLALLSGSDFSLPFGDVAEIQGRVLDALSRGVDRPPSNPARSLAESLGGGARLNPRTEETRGAVGDPVEKIRVLDELRGLLPVTEKG